MPLKVLWLAQAGRCLARGLSCKVDEDESFEGMLGWGHTISFCAAAVKGHVLYIHIHATGNPPTVLAARASDSSDSAVCCTSQCVCYVTSVNCLVVGEHRGGDGSVVAGPGGWGISFVRGLHPTAVTSLCSLRMHPQAVAEGWRSHGCITGHPFSMQNAQAALLWVFVSACAQDASLLRSTWGGPSTGVGGGAMTRRRV